MIQLRQWYHDDMRRFYESCINGEVEGQHDRVMEELLDDSMETAKNLHSDRVHDCAMYTRLVELIEWGRTNNLKIDDLYNHRVECYHDDDYWKECCHGEYE
jgi:hypothetical protein